MELHANTVRKQKTLKTSMQPQSVRGHQPVPVGGWWVGRGEGTCHALGPHCVTLGRGSSCESGCRCSCLGGPSGWKQSETHPPPHYHHCDSPTHTHKYTHTLPFFLCIISLLYPTNIPCGMLLHVHLDTRAVTVPAGQQIWLLHHPPKKGEKKVPLSHGVVCEFMRLHLALSEPVARPSCQGEKVAVEMTASTSGKEKRPVRLYRKKGKKKTPSSLNASCRNVFATRRQPGNQLPTPF